MSQQNNHSLTIDFGTQELRTLQHKAPSNSVQITIATEDLKDKLEEAIRFRAKSMGVRSNLVKPQDIIELTVKFQIYENEEKKLRDHFKGLLEQEEDLEITYIFNECFSQLFRLSPNFKNYVFGYLDEKVDIEEVKQSQTPTDLEEACGQFKIKTRLKSEIHEEFKMRIKNALESVACFRMDIPQKMRGYMAEHFAGVEREELFDDDFVYFYCKDIARMLGCLKVVSSLAEKYINLAHIFRPQDKLTIAIENFLGPVIDKNKDLEISVSGSVLKVFGPLNSIQKLQHSLHMLCFDLHFKQFQWKRSPAVIRAIEELIAQEQQQSLGSKHTSSEKTLMNTVNLEQTSGSIKSHISKNSKVSKKSHALNQTIQTPKKPVFIVLDQNSKSSQYYITISMACMSQVDLAQSYDSLLMRLQNTITQVVSLRGKRVSEEYMEQSRQKYGIFIESDKSNIYLSGPRQTVQKLQAEIQTILVQREQNTLLLDPQKNEEHDEQDSEPNEDRHFTLQIHPGKMRDIVLQKFSFYFTEQQSTDTTEKVNPLKLKTCNIDEAINIKREILQLVMLNTGEAYQYVSPFWESCADTMVRINISHMRVKEKELIQNIIGDYSILKNITRVQDIEKYRSLVSTKKGSISKGLILTHYPYEEALDLVRRRNLITFKVPHPQMGLAWEVRKRIPKYCIKQTLLICEYFGKGRQTEWLKNQIDLRILYVIEIYRKPTGPHILKFLNEF